jgi:hypothetical protein
MHPPPYMFTLAPGQYFRTRSVGFVQDVSGEEMDAHGTYQGLKPKIRLTVDSRFKHWLDRQVFQKYFHGFDGVYSACFTFKWEERHVPQRLYGFICHPKPKTDPSFELCVLMYFDTKADKTNYTKLGWINQLRINSMVVAAIAKEYPEFSAGEVSKLWN